MIFSGNKPGGCFCTECEEAFDESSAAHLVAYGEDDDLATRCPSCGAIDSLVDNDEEPEAPHRFAPKRGKSPQLQQSFFS